MEVRLGFKQTEIGIIPEDWEVKEIGDFAPFITSGSRGWAKYYSENGLFFLRITNMIRGSIYLDLKYLRYVQLPVDENEGKRTQLKIGDVLISITADIGIVSFVNESVITPAYINQHVALVRFDNEIINSKFVSYFLISDKAQKHFASLTDSGAKAGMSLVRLSKIKVGYPKIAEQTAIATALSDADALISSLEKLIAKKRNIKQGAMQKLLQPKEGWEVKKLGEIANVNMGQSPLSEYYNSEGIGLPLIQGNADVDNRKTIIRFYTSMITKRGKTGDIIMSVRAPVGEISKATFDCCLGRGVCAISFDNEYLYHYLIYFEKSWAKLSTGSTFDSVNSKQVKELEIPIPASKNEQIEIANILSDMDNEINALETKLEKYRNVKLGMMQNLLTGKIRLV